MGRTTVLTMRAAKFQTIWGGLANLLKGAPKVELFDNVEHLSG